MFKFSKWILIAVGAMPTSAFATWQIAGSPIVVHSAAPNHFVADYPKGYWNNPAFNLETHKGTLAENVDPYSEHHGWSVDWKAGNLFPVLLKGPLKGPSFSYVLNLLFEHYPLAVIYDEPNHLMRVMPAPKTAAEARKGFWVKNGKAYYKVYDGVTPTNVRPQGRPSTRIPQATFVAELTPGSLKANILHILQEAGWPTVIWQLPYDYNWVGHGRVAAPSVQDALQTIFQNYPLQAVFYEMNHVVVIQEKEAP